MVFYSMTLMHSLQDWEAAWEQTVSRTALYCMHQISCIKSKKVRPPLFFLTSPCYPLKAGNLSYMIPFYED